MWYTHTKAHYLALVKKWNSAICDNMNGHGGNFAKWHMPDIEGQILYDST